MNKLPSNKKIKTGSNYIFESVRTYSGSAKKESNLNLTVFDQRKHISNWLKSHKYAVLATSYKNKPWAATINYLSDDNWNLYLDIDENSTKYRNLINNPTVALVIDNKTREGTLQLQGTAMPLTGKNDKKANFLIKPSFIIFRRIDDLGEIQMMILNLQKTSSINTIGNKSGDKSGEEKGSSK